MRIVTRVGKVCEGTKNRHKSWEGLSRNKESSPELGRFVKEQRIITRVGKVCEATKNHHKSWKLCRARIISVGSFLRARGFLGFAVVCFFRFMVMSAFGNCCVGFCSWRIQ